MTITATGDKIFEYRKTYFTEFFAQRLYQSIYVRAIYETEHAGTNRNQSKYSNSNYSQEYPDL